MAIKILLIGKDHKGFVTDGVQEYLKRLKRFTKLDYKVLSDVKGASSMSAEQVKNKEGEKFLAEVQATDRLLLMDENGKQYTSRKFALFLEQQIQQHGQTVIVIGGAYGFSQEVKQRANAVISFSAMTLSHQLIRVVLLEQLFRAFAILNNHPYHND